MVCRADRRAVLSRGVRVLDVSANGSSNKRGENSIRNARPRTETLNSGFVM
jgi:hypothetical protein